MRQNFLFLGLILLLQLAGCDQSTTTHYTYGKTLKCFEQSQTNKPCRHLRPYDEVTISANSGSQQVTMVIRGIDLSKENTVFKTMTNCKVVNKENFSCNELTLDDGIVSTSTALHGKIIGQSAILFYVSNLLDLTIREDVIRLFDSTIAKVIAGILIFCFLISANG